MTITGDDQRKRQDAMTAAARAEVPAMLDTFDTLMALAGRERREEAFLAVLTQADEPRAHAALAVAALTLARIRPGSLA